MTKIQSFALGMFLLTLGGTALIQVMDFDNVMRIVSIEALGTISIVASLVFFIFIFRN